MTRQESRAFRNLANGLKLLALRGLILTKAPHSCSSQPVQIWRSRPIPRFCGLDSHSPGPHDANEPILARKCEREDANPSRTLVAQMLSLSHSSPTLAPRAQQTFARSTRAPSGKLLPTAANRSHMPWQSTVTFLKPVIPSRAATAATPELHQPLTIFIFLELVSILLV